MNKKKQVNEEENQLAEIIQERFRNLRESIIDEKGKPLSCRKLAEAMGVPGYFTKINLIECGDRTPSIRDLKRYREYFNVTIEYLLGLSDIPTYESENFSSSIDINQECLDTKSLKYLKELVKDNEQAKLKTINFLLNSKYGNEIINALTYLLFSEKASIKAELPYCDMFDKCYHEIVTFTIKDKALNSLDFKLNDENIRGLLFEHLQNSIVHLQKNIKNQKPKVRVSKQ